MYSKIFTHTKNIFNKKFNDKYHSEFLIAYIEAKSTTKWMNISVPVTEKFKISRNMQKFRTQRKFEL